MAVSAPLLQLHPVQTSDGWTLPLTALVMPERLVPGSRPLLLVPGYGMNSAIFRYHPAGRSLAHTLAAEGFEVWMGGFRGQKAARARRGAPPPGLAALAEIDLPAQLQAVLAGSRTGAAAVDLIGVSLGGSISYAYLALHRDAPVGAMVAVCAPLRWVTRHLLLRLAFASRRLAGAVPMWGSASLARVALPLLARAPGALSIYLNADHINLDDADRILETVDRPHRRLNRQLAAWMGQQDMVLGGVNITAALRRVVAPLLVVHTNRDQIVPPPVALSVVGAWGGSDLEVMKVGDAEDWYAHADLFMAPRAPEQVFAPLARWLAARQGACRLERA